MTTPTTGALVPNLPGFDQIIQDNALVKQFEDALYPQLLYRMEARPELWEGEAGDRRVFTRSSLLPPRVKSITPGEDPDPRNQAFEQWVVQAQQYTDSSDTHMPTSHLALAAKVLRDAHTLGLQSGQSINRVSRNRLFCAYVGGNTIADGGATSTALVVASINGFTEVLIDGVLQPVSSTNPLPITIGATLIERNVIAAAPTDSNFPFGAGTLTLDASATFVAADAVKALQGTTIIRPGGVLTIDGLTTASILTLTELRRAVAELRSNNVPPHADGYYHCHLDPFAENQAFADNEFQRLNEQNYGDAPYQQFAVGKLLGSIFYTNSESPGESTTGALQTSRPADAPLARLGEDIQAEVINKTDVRILRTIITGGGSMYEKYVDESNYISLAGVTGQVGAFSITNNGLQVVTDRIRYIVRAPLDRLQQVISQTWSWTGDFAIPSDQLTGRNAARFKRAVVIEHALD